MNWMNGIDCVMIDLGCHLGMDREVLMGCDPSGWRRVSRPVAFFSFGAHDE